MSMTLKDNAQNFPRYFDVGLVMFTLKYIFSDIFDTVNTIFSTLALYYCHNQLKLCGIVTILPSSSNHSAEKARYRGLYITLSFRV